MSSFIFTISTCCLVSDRPPRFKLFKFFFIHSHSYFLLIMQRSYSFFCSPLSPSGTTSKTARIPKNISGLCTITDSSLRQLLGVYSSLVTDHLRSLYLSIHVSMIASDIFPIRPLILSTCTRPLPQLYPRMCNLFLPLTLWYGPLLVTLISVSGAFPGILCFSLSTIYLPLFEPAFYGYPSISGMVSEVIWILCMCSSLCPSLVVLVIPYTFAPPHVLVDLGLGISAFASLENIPQTTI